MTSTWRSWKKTCRALSVNVVPALLLTVCLFAQALAAEPLSFSYHPSGRTWLLTSRFITQSLPRETAGYHMARADLNGDRIDEIIFRPASCGKKPAPCLYTVSGIKDNALISLLQVKARNMAIAGRSSGGVRDLIVYESPENDYTGTVYIWEPGQLKYILKE